jgi:hypothetical protein
VREADNLTTFTCLNLLEPSGPHRACYGIPLPFADYMTFAQRRNRLTTLFSERIDVVKRRMTVLNAHVRYCFETQAM